jgi:hypothetical protein
MPQQMRPLSGAAETTANVTIGFDQGYAPANLSRSAGPNEPDRMRCTECNFKGMACPNSQSGPIWHNYAPYINKAVDMAHKFDKQCCMKTNRPRLPDAQECALLFLRLLEIRKEEAPGASRARVSELTLRRLWGRDRIGRELLEEIQEWLWRGGWSLFYARRTYGAVRTNAVLGWARLSSKRMADELEQVREGTFDFDSCLHLIRDEPGQDD